MTGSCWRSSRAGPGCAAITSDETSRAACSSTGGEYQGHGPPFAGQHVGTETQGHRIVPPARYARPRRARLTWLRAARGQHVGHQQHDAAGGGRLRPFWQPQRGRPRPQGRRASRRRRAGRPPWSAAALARSRSSRACPARSVEEADRGGHQQRQRSAAARPERLRQRASPKRQQARAAEGRQRQRRHVPGARPRRGLGGRRGARSRSARCAAGTSGPADHRAHREQRAGGVSAEVGDGGPARHG